MSWLFVGATVLTVAGGYENAENNKRLSKYQNIRTVQDRDNAVISQTYTNQGLNEQLRQEEEITADQKLELQIQALQASSNEQLRDNGVAGVSSDRRQASISTALGNAISQLDSNAAGTRRQTELEKKGGAHRTASRINSMQLIKPQAYNPTADIAKGGLQIYGGYQGAKADARTADKPEPSFTQYAFGD